MPRRGGGTAVGGHRPVRLNLGAALEAMAAENGWLGERAYLVGDQVYTYAAVYEGARALAGVLLAHGVQPGHRVLIALPDSIEVVWSFLGTLKAGAVAVMANPRLPAHELRAACGRTDPAVIVCDPSIAEAFDGGTVLTADRMVSEGENAWPATAAICAPSGLAYALFTSGTTGEAKLCFHTHSDALVYHRAFGKPVLGLAPGDVTFSVSKSYFAYGLGNSVLFPLLSGATAVLEPEVPTADRILELTARLGVGTLFSVPSNYARLLAHPQASVLGAVGVAVCAGEVLPRAVEDRVLALDGPILLNGIGSTEVGQTFASNTMAERRAGTVGRVLHPYRVRVADDAGADLPAGTRGRLLVRGPTLALGCAAANRYLPAPAGLWYPTGDLAVRDEEDYLSIIGRLDDIEIVGGINVHPTEIEELLAGHPLVLDAAVCATVDPQGASRLVAYVVAADHAVDQAAIADDLIAGLRGQVVPYKLPRGVVFVPELPRTFTGKLRRNALRQSAVRHSETGVWPVSWPAL